MNLKTQAEELKRKLHAQDTAQVKIALFGQPGAGKSTLINTFIGHEVARTGVETDVTRAAQSHEHNGLLFVDLPGYDTAMFPKETFWQSQSIDSFDLFLCVFTMRFKAADTELFNRLRKAGKVVLWVSNKADTLWQPNKTRQELEGDIVEDARRQTGDATAEVFFTSCVTRSGISELEAAIAAHLDEAKAERWARSAAAYTVEALDAKRAACERYIAIAAGAAAANGLNPIPGLDVAVDMGILTKLFADIRACYGLDQERLNFLEKIPGAAPIVREIVLTMAKEGLVSLLKRFAGREAVKSGSKWVPFVGQVVAAALGFAMTMQAGIYFNKKCYEAAKLSLETELAQRPPA